MGSKGRAVHRKDSSATGVSSLLSGSAASEPVVDPLALRVKLQSSNYVYFFENMNWEVNHTKESTLH